MTKIRANITIDYDIWEAAKTKYPDLISAMIENFLKESLNDKPIKSKETDEEKKKRRKRQEQFAKAWRMNNPLRFID